MPKTVDLQSWKPVRRVALPLRMPAIDNAFDQTTIAARARQGARKPGKLAG